MTFNKEEVIAKAKQIFTHPLAISIYIAIAIFFVILIILSFWIKSYTHHGEELTLPNLSGMTTEEAGAKLADMGLTYTIYDSIYTANVKAGCVVSQTPNAGDKVKSGRCIFLAIRAKKPRQIKLPDFRDKSLRQYQGELESSGLKVKDIVFVPSQFNTVMGVKCDGKSLAVGHVLTEGAQVTLNVGKGATNEYSEMPSVHGMAMNDAVNKIQSMALNVRTVFDVQPSSEDNKRFYKVWKQQPLAKSKLSGNETVTIFLTTNQAKLSQTEETAGAREDEAGDKED